jgi:hypothetical protein
MNILSAMLLYFSKAKRSLFKFESVLNTDSASKKEAYLKFKLFQFLIALIAILRHGFCPHFDPPFSISFTFRLDHWILTLIFVKQRSLKLSSKIYSNVCILISQKNFGPFLHIFTIFWYFGDTNFLSAIFFNFLKPLRSLTS